MLTKDEIHLVEEEVIKLKNARLVLGFYPSLISKKVNLNEEEVVQYLDTVGVEKYGMRHQYVLHDENVVLVGKYDKIEDVPQDEMVENEYGEEVYVGENWYSVLYLFNR